MSDFQDVATAAPDDLADLAQDTPAPAPKARKSRAKTTTGSKRRQSLTAPIEVLLVTGGQVWSIRDDECGPALVAQAHEIAVGLNAWAQQDPRVYKYLSTLVNGGGAGGLVLAIWPLAVQVANHHVLPAIQRRRDLIAEAQGWGENPLADETTPDGYVPTHSETSS